LLPLVDLALVPFVAIGSSPLKTYRYLGSKKLPLCTASLRKIGVFPICDHYYEPLFNDVHLKKSLGAKRNLPGINFRRDEQVKLLDCLTCQNDFEEFLKGQLNVHPSGGFAFENRQFVAGDAEFLFNFVRHTKPQNVIEIGYGTSAKLISALLDLNMKEVGERARHVCIEPCEQPWLERFSNIELVREKVEDADSELFKSLGSNDLLFIDSPHMIRPQGDVLYEYLDVLPMFNERVFVHACDIFTPCDYPEVWVKDKVLFCIEQYLLEAVLSKNSSFNIVAALNYLKHEEFDSLKRVYPCLNQDKEPGSFYFQALKR